MISNSWKELAKEELQVLAWGSILDILGFHIPEEVGVVDVLTWLFYPSLGRVGKGVPLLEGEMGAWKSIYYFATSSCYLASCVWEHIITV